MFTPDLMRQKIDFLSEELTTVYIYIYKTDFVGQNTDFSSEKLNY